MKSWQIYFFSRSVNVYFYCSISVLPSLSYMNGDCNISTLGMWLWFVQRHDRAPVVCADSTNEKQHQQEFASDRGEGSGLGELVSPCRDGYVSLSIVKQIMPRMIALKPTESRATMMAPLCSLSFEDIWIRCRWSIWPKEHRPLHFSGACSFLRECGFWLAVVTEQCLGCWRLSWRWTWRYWNCGF